MQYNIQGDMLPVVICTLRPGECMITERGSMSWMSPNMYMETTTNGGIGKLFGRSFAGEAMFQNRYTAMDGPGLIAFASSFPGSIMPFNIAPGHDIVLQRTAFLASEPGVELSVFFQKRFGTALFGGEGLIMQRLSGYGTAFAEFDGSIITYELQPGQTMIIDTGYLAAMDATCTMDVQSISGVKNVLFGGEGLFNTTVTGPGRVYLQTMPISAVASALLPYIPTSSD